MVEELAWEDWLSHHRYYGPRITLQDVRDKCRSAAASVDLFLSELVHQDDSRRARDKYDPRTNEWTYVIVDFSENFGDYIQTLNVLAHIAAFKDLPGPGHALIFHHLYGNEAVDALLCLDVGQARFVDPTLPESQAFAVEAAVVVERALSWRRWFS
jgi:hypothetical protein